jgi:hypothetical protein
MNVKKQFGILINEAQQLLRVIELLILDGLAQNRDTDKLVRWRHRLDRWLTSLIQLKANQNDSLFEFKCYGWGLHFSNLAHFFDGDFPWSKHNAEYDVQFDRVYSEARLLASGADGITLPMEAAPSI